MIKTSNRKLTKVTRGHDHDEDGDDEGGESSGGGSSNSRGKSRRISFMGDVNQGLVRSTIESIYRLVEEDSSPIYLLISTYGGFTDDAFALYDVMRTCGVPVRTVGLGKVMSAGTLILAAGEKGHRLIGAHSSFMYHAGHMGAYGDVFAQENSLKEMKEHQKKFDIAVASETGKPLKKVEGLYVKSRLDHFMNPKQVVAFGFADKVL